MSVLKDICNHQQIVSIVLETLVIYKHWYDYIVENSIELILLPESLQSKEHMSHTNYMQSSEMKF